MPPEQPPRWPEGALPRRAAQAEYVAAGGNWFAESYYRSLPLYIDDLSRDFGSDIYERMMLDDQVAGGVRTFVVSILSDPLTVRPWVDDDKDPDYEDSKTYAEFCERALGNLLHRMRRSVDAWLLEVVGGSVALGNRVTEKVAALEESGQDAGRLVWDRLKVKPRNRTAFVLDPFNNLLGLLAVMPGRFDLAAGSIITPDMLQDSSLLPPEKFAILSWDPKEEDPRGTSLLRTVYEAWWEKLQVAREWLKHLSQFGSPSLWGTTAPDALDEPQVDADGNPIPGATISPEQKLLNELLKFRNGYALALPNGSTLNVLQTANAGDGFLKKIEHCERRIDRAILLAARTRMEAKHGSKADSETSQDITGQAVRQAKGWAAEMVTRDLIYPLMLWNFGPDAAKRLCPYASLAPVEHQDWSQTANAVAPLVSVGFLKPSQFPAMYDKLGLPPAEEPLADDQQQNATPPPAPGEEDFPADNPEEAGFAGEYQEPLHPRGYGGKWVDKPGGEDHAQQAREYQKQARQAHGLAERGLEKALAELEPLGARVGYPRSLLVVALRHALGVRTDKAYERSGRTQELAQTAARELARYQHAGPQVQTAQAHAESAVEHAGRAAQAHQQGQEHQALARATRKQAKRAVLAPERKAWQEAVLAASPLLPSKAGSSLDDLGSEWDEGQEPSLVRAAQRQGQEFLAAWKTGDAEQVRGAAVALRTAVVAVSSQLAGQAEAEHTVAVAREVALAANRVVKSLQGVQRTRAEAGLGTAEFAGGEYQEPLHPRGYGGKWTSKGTDQTHEQHTEQLTWRGKVANLLRQALSQPGKSVASVLAAAEALHAAYREGGFRAVPKVAVLAAYRKAKASFGKLETRYGRKAAIAMAGAYLSCYAAYAANPVLMLYLPSPTAAIIGTAEALRALSKGARKLAGKKEGTATFADEWMDFLAEIGEAAFAFGLPSPYEEGKHPRGYGGRWKDKPQMPDIRDEIPKIKDNPEKDKAKKAKKEWDGKIEQDRVEPERGIHARITNWDFYDDEGNLYPQEVVLRAGTYDPDPDNPSGELIDVYRWESRDDGGTNEHGDWTADEEEAAWQGEQFALRNDQDPPEKDKDKEDKSKDDEEEGSRRPVQEVANWDQAATKREAQAIFNTMTDATVLGLLGASTLEGATVQRTDVQKWKAHYSDDVPIQAYGIEVNVRHPYFSKYRRFLGVDAEGNAFIRNDHLEIEPEHQGKGLGSALFARQVQEAAAEGFAYLCNHAAGEKDSTMNGYYTWPLLGYDMSLERIRETNRPLARKMERAFPEAESVLDVFATKEGRSWWKENGSDLYDARFDLAKDSRSRQVLEAYLEERSKKGAKSGG